MTENSELYSARWSTLTRLILMRLLFVGLLTLGAAPAYAAKEGAQSTQPAGVVIPDHGSWSAFVQVKGKNFASATSVRAFWYPDDDDSKAPLMQQTATYRGRKGTDEITIQIPGDPSKSGWSGDFANGVLRIYLIMPGQKQPLLAAKYTVGTMPATASAMPATGTTEPTPVSGTSQVTRSEGGETSSSTSAMTQSKGKKPSSTIRILPLKKSKEMVGMTGGATTPDTVHPVTGSPQGVQVAGAPTTASTQSAIGGDMPQVKTPAAAGSGISSKTLEGPGTTITSIDNNVPAQITVHWKSVAGASAYRVHASPKGFNQLAVTPDIPHPPNTTLTVELESTLKGLVPGATHNVWVSVHYPDGRQGVSPMQEITARNPANPQGFKAVPIGPGALRLEWTAVDGASGYRVEGDNLPRMQTTDTAVAVTNLPPGKHNWTLISIYPPGVFDDINPSKLTATVGVNVAGSATYRITINGFKVDRETLDDPLQRDGKGDEVYVAAYWAEYDVHSGQRIRSGVVKSFVFGDKNGFGAGRLLAGHAGDSGGLKRNDVYPESGPANKVSAPTADGIPFLITTVELSEDNFVVFIPSIWEWDGDGQDFENWKNTLRNNASEARFRLNLALADDVKNGRFVNLPGAHLGASYSKPPGNIFSDTGNLLGQLAGTSQLDRPIGIMISGGGFEYSDIAHAINREFIENVLAGNWQSPLPPGVFSYRFRDDPSANDKLGGDYTLYVQVERLP